MEKLNKKQEGVYVIEEEKTIASGKWEGYLDHDNVNHQTIYIYTGPKLTGEKVENYFISTPSETPWKTHLKAFSNSEKIYITYESTGDQVEAEDVNLVQDGIVNEIERATVEETRIDTKLDNEIIRAFTTDEKLNEDVEELKEIKANKTYVDTELNKKYNKDEVFTKAEVLKKIEEIIDAAPDALNTLGKIAEALNEDPDFAATITNELANKVDKVEGKGLSDENYTLTEKNKLAGIEKGANKYTHPSTHSADMIVDTSSKRFASDVEKAEWNSKETLEGAQSKANKAETNAKNYADSIKPTKVSELENDKNYVTQEELGDAGLGDMLKSTYDTNNNGKVDIAENAEKLGGKLPSEYMNAAPLTWADLKGV